MARAPRVQPAGGTFHVTGRGVAGNALFRDDRDRSRFLDVLADVVERCEWSCHAYCLMTTHFHLVPHTPQPNLAEGMKRLNALYAQGFNRVHGARGHVFESRYFSVLVETEPHVLELARYVVLNPVRAGMCARPEDWPWSSYRASAGLCPAPAFLTVGWLLAHFGANVERARERFGSFVWDGLAAA